MALRSFAVSMSGKRWRVDYYDDSLLIQYGDECYTLEHGSEQWANALSLKPITDPRVVSVLKAIAHATKMP